MENRLDSRSLLNLVRSDERRNARTGAGAVRNIHSIESGSRAELRFFHGLREQISLRRNDFHRINPFMVCKFLRKRRFFRRRNGLFQRNFGCGDLNLRRTFDFRHRVDAPRHVADMIRSGSATAADAARAESDAAHGVSREVFRTAHVDHAVVHVLRHARVRLNDNRIRTVVRKSFKRRKCGSRAGTAVEPERRRLMLRLRKKRENCGNVVSALCHGIAVNLNADHVRILRRGGFKRGGCNLHIIK